jgi:GTP-binding protein
MERSRSGFEGRSIVVKVRSADFVISAVTSRQLLRDDLPEIAFVGRSNVGKSSLINRLLGRQGLARTSRTPGRTQAVNYFLIDRRWYCVDLPGYGFAKAARQDRQRWAQLMNAYFRTQGEKKLLIHLVDAKVGATPLDVEARQYFAELGLECLVAATKIDKVPRSRRSRGLTALRQALAMPEAPEVVPFSAVSGEGVKELWTGITAFLATPREGPPETGKS